MLHADTATNGSVGLKIFKIKEYFLATLSVVALLLLGGEQYYVIFWLAFTGLLLGLVSYRFYPLSFNFLNFLILGYLGISLLRVIADGAGLSIPTLYVYALGLLSYLTGLMLKTRHLKLFLHVFLVATFMLVLWGLLQYFTGRFDYYPLHGRANTLFANANLFGSIIYIALLLVSGVYIKKPSPWLLLFVFIFATGLFATHTRAGMVALFCALAFMSLLLWPNKQRLWSLGRVTVSVILAAVFMISSDALLREQGSPEAVGDRTLAVRILNIADTGDPRLEQYSKALEAGYERPWWGHGPTSFGALYYRLQEAQPYVINNAHVHNDFLQLWVEFGVSTLPFLLLFLLLIYWRVLQRRRQSRLTVLQITVAAAILAILVHAQFSFPLHMATHLSVTLLLAGYLVRTLSSHRGADTARHVNFCGMAQSVLIVVALLPVIADFFLYQAKKYHAGEQLQEAVIAAQRARLFNPFNSAGYMLEANIRTRLALQFEDTQQGDIAERLILKSAGRDARNVSLMIPLLAIYRDFPRILSRSLDENARQKMIRFIAEYMYEQKKNDLDVQLEYIRTMHALGDYERMYAFIDRLKNEHRLTTQLLNRYLMKTGVNDFRLE